MRLLHFACIALIAPWCAFSQGYSISTLAGGALPINIQGTAANLASPYAVVSDSSGNVFFLDYNLVLQLNQTTGVVTLVAGGGVVIPGSSNRTAATSAQLPSPSSLALDSSGNLYIADESGLIFKVSSGIITTYVGLSTGLNSPEGIAVDTSGNLYIADTFNNLIRKVSNGVVTNIAGNGLIGFKGDGGPATSASLWLPYGVAVDSAGNLYIADTANSRIRKVSNGVMTTIAGNGNFGFTGDGSALTNWLNGPEGIAVDSAGNVYVADTFNNLIRKVVGGGISSIAGTSTCQVYCFAGDGGAANAAEVYEPTGVSLDSAGNIYIADTLNNRIRKVSSGVINTVAGSAPLTGNNGPATSAELFNPGGVVLDSSGNVYIADRAAGLIRKVSGGVISVFAGGGKPNLATGNIGDNGPATAALLVSPTGLAFDSANNLYISDSSLNTVRKISNGTITTIAGNGTAGYSGDGQPALAAELNGPQGIAVDSAGNVYIADTGNNRVRRVAPSGVITTVAGNGKAGITGDGGPATSAELAGVFGVAVDASGNLFITDSTSTLSSVIREISRSVISSIPFTNPSTAPFISFGIAVDAADHLFRSGNSLPPGGLNFVGLIGEVSNGNSSVIAGGGPGPGIGDGGLSNNAQLNIPYAVAVDPSGRIYIADAGNSRVRLLTPVPLSVSTTSFPAGTVGIPFSGTATAIGGTGIYTWSATGLPAGLTFTPAGVFGGIPSLAGTFNPSLTVKDSGGNSASSTISMTILSANAPVVSGLNPSSAVAMGAAFTLTVNGSGFVSGSIVQWNGSALSTNFVSTTQLTAAVGASLIATAGSANVTVANPGGAPSGPVAFSITASNAPVISQGGIDPLFSSVPVIQPGSWVSLYGNNLANGNYLWNGDFPTSLGNVSLTINNKPAYLWYVSPTQINFQAPGDTTTGPVNVVLTTGSATATSTVTLAQYGPSLCLLDSKHVAGIIATPNGSGAYGNGTYDLVGPKGAFNFNTRPVKPGEVLVLYGVGFGPTTPHVPSGQSFSGSAPTTLPVTINIGGVPASVGYAGITEAGEYQFNLTVPQGVSSGDQQLQVSINGVQVPAGPVVTIQ